MTAQPTLKAPLGAVQVHGVVRIAEAETPVHAMRTFTIAAFGAFLVLLAETYRNGEGRLHGDIWLN